MSNLGGPFGIKQFCAIVNPPQSAILAIGSGNMFPKFLYWSHPTPLLPCSCIIVFFLKKRTGRSSAQHYSCISMAVWPWVISVSCETASCSVLLVLDFPIAPIHRNPVHDLGP